MLLKKSKGFYKISDTVQVEIMCAALQLTKHFDNSTCRGTTFPTEYFSAPQYKCMKEPAILKTYVLKLYSAVLHHSNNGDVLRNSSDRNPGRRNLPLSPENTPTFSTRSGLPSGVRPGETEKTDFRSASTKM